VRIYVVDASVAAKWLIPEPDTSLAVALLCEGIVLHAPDLIYAELGSVLMKRQGRGDISANECIAAFDRVARMPVAIAPTERLMTGAFRVASDTKRSFYDSLYVALAIELKTWLITEDVRLWNALQSTHYRDRVARLAEVLA
jgi:predicted nucleic acid-binding protein